MLLLVACVAARRQSAQDAAGSVLLVAAATVLPIAAVVFWQMRRGRWRDVDASQPEERPALFAFAMFLLAGLAVWQAVSAGPTFMMRGTTAVFVLLVVCRGLLRWTKVSLHVAFAGLAAAVLLLDWPAAGVVAVLLVPVIAWSRVALGRHTAVETVAGAVLGAAIGAAAVLL